MAGELLRHGLDVYLPCVDDQSIDMIVRVERPDGVKFYDVQIKSVAGYNRIIGVKDPTERSNDYILIIHYRHTNKPDEFYYLTKQEILLHHLKDSAWGDLVFNKAERAQYANKALADLADAILNGKI